MYSKRLFNQVTMNMAERTRKSGQVRMVAEVGLNPEQARRVSRHAATAALTSVNALLFPGGGPKRGGGAESRDS